MELELGQLLPIQEFYFLENLFAFSVSIFGFNPIDKNYKTTISSPPKMSSSGCIVRPRNERHVFIVSLAFLSLRCSNRQSWTASSAPQQFLASALRRPAAFRLPAFKLRYFLISLKTLDFSVKISFNEKSFKMTSNSGEETNKGDASKCVAEE